MKLRYIYSIAAALLMFASCSSEDGLENFSGTQSADVLNITSVEQQGFTTDAHTRATYQGYATKFESGDKLGLILIDAEGRQIDNAPFTYSENGWINDKAVSYTSKIDRIIAYFPYKDALATDVATTDALKNSISIPFDQSSLDAFKLADILVCELDDVTAELQLHFAHAFSLIDLSALASVTVGEETFSYSIEMSDVALSFNEAIYTPCNLNGTYVCLVKDNTALQPEDFRYFYTLSGATAVKTVKNTLTTVAGKRYTFPIQAMGAVGNVSVGDFYCVSEQSGKAVIIPAVAGALPKGLVCKGIVFYAMNSGEFENFCTANGLTAGDYTGHDASHGLMVSVTNGLYFGTKNNEGIKTAVQSVANSSNTTISNGYGLTQALAVIDGFSALNNHKGDQVPAATTWYLPSFNELGYLIQGADRKNGSTQGQIQINKQISKIANGTMLTGNFPSVTYNEGFCIMENGTEMGWHGVPDEAFRPICAF